MNSSSRIHGLLLGCALAWAGCATPRVQLGPREAWVSVGSVSVDLATHSVIATGYVNQVGGALELLACGPDGKRHESALVIQSDLLDLQTALLLIGLKGGKPMKSLGVGPPAGAPVDVVVEWTERGQPRQLDAAALLTDRHTGHAPPDATWIYTGSVFEDGKFMALAEQSIIATYWDPWALINISAPYGEDDERIDVNAAHIPPMGTPVRILITAR